MCSILLLGGLGNATLKIRCDEIESVSNFRQMMAGPAYTSYVSTQKFQNLYLRFNSAMSLNSYYNLYLSSTSDLQPSTATANQLPGQ